MKTTICCSNYKFKVNKLCLDGANDSFLASSFADDAADGMEGIGLGLGGGRHHGARARRRGARPPRSGTDGFDRGFIG